MPHAFAMLVLIFALPCVAPSQTETLSNRSGSNEDAAAIKQVIMHWQEGWDQLNSKPLIGDYADDADWMNAFGRKQKGAADIVTSMESLFRSPAVKARRTTFGEPRIKFLRPDVALAYRDYQSVGTKLPDGKDMPRRNTHSTWILTKESGKWLIASQVISDDKEAAPPPPKPNN